MIKYFRSTASVVAALVGIVGVLLILYVWRLPPFTGGEEITDNAYVRGQTTILSPQVTGYIAEVLVQDYQEVKAGQLLVRIDDRIYFQQVKQAEAAQDNAKANYERSESLFQSKMVPQSTLDQNRATLEAAQAALELAKINLANTKILAPEDGRLGEVTARLGQYVAAGTQLTSIVPRKIWVTANFKETQMKGMEVGKEVSFTVDALNHKKFTGRIESLSPAAGSEFSVLKPDNATGNFTKVTQRIPVRIAIDPNQEGLDKLAPGMSVVVRVKI
jgi:RND family efflux transporter MFP subunit